MKTCAFRPPSTSTIPQHAPRGAGPRGCRWRAPSISSSHSTHGLMTWRAQRFPQVALVSLGYLLQRRRTMRSSGSRTRWPRFCGEALAAACTPIKRMPPVRRDRRPLAAEYGAVASQRSRCEIPRGRYRGRFILKPTRRRGSAVDTWRALPRDVGAVIAPSSRIALRETLRVRVSQTGEVLHEQIERYGSMRTRPACCSLYSRRRRSRSRAVPPGSGDAREVPRTAAGPRAARRGDRSRAG
jgi:hypothetical protein